MYYSLRFLISEAESKTVTTIDYYFVNISFNSNFNFFNILMVIFLYFASLFKILEGLSSKIQQTKMLVMCQRFGDLFLFGLVWQYSSVQTKYNKGRFKHMATYLQQ